LKSGTVRQLLIIGTYMRYNLFSDNVVYLTCVLSVFLLSLIFPQRTISGDNIAFPGAMGWGSETRGAWGHPSIEPVILKVSSLSGAMEEGTLRWALTRNYPRIVVFEVGGVIDLEWSYISINNPYLTIAGQTAPSPGITIIKGGIILGTNFHSGVIQHIAIRTGQHRVPIDNRFYSIIITNGANNIIIDHCSFIWGTHGPVGITNPTNPPNNITFSNCIIAEGVENLNLRHSMGMYVNANVYDLAVIRNLFKSNAERNPVFGGTKGIYINNYISGWAGNCTYADDNDGLEWTYIGNYACRGNYYPDSNTWRGLFFYTSSNYDANMYFEDNQSYDYLGNSRPIYGTTSTGRINLLDSPGQWHESLDGQIISSDNIRDYLDSNVGARPWDRDPIDERIVEEALAVSGMWPVGAEGIAHPQGWHDGIMTWGTEPFVWPDYEPTDQQFNPDEWDLRYMIPLAGYWPAPELIAPGNNAMDLGSSPTFIWDAENYLTHFTLQIATDEEFTSLLIEEAGITGTSRTISNLDGSTTYYWRVRGHNATGPSKWSEVRHFRIESETSSMKIFLQSGWNLISSYLLPENTSIEYIFSDLSRHHVLVKNNEGEVYWPQYGLNEIGDWVYHQGYRVYVQENDTLMINGHLVHPEETQINLYEGWNQVAYLRNSPLGTDAALSSINDRILIVINNAGEVFWPEYDIDTIEQLIPGQGYSMYLTEPAILIYPANE
jgi:pectate lyase